MDFSEKWGKDIDEAVRLALIDLNLTIDQVNVIVLEEPSKGFFGIGSKLAKVRVEKKVEEKVEKPIENDDEALKTDSYLKKNRSAHKETKKVLHSEEKPEREKPQKDSQSKTIKKERRRERPRKYREEYDSGSFILREKPKDLVEVEDKTVQNFLEDITTKMGLDLNISVLGNDNCIFVDINGKDSGTIIGKRGQTLDAIQYLTSLVVNKDREKYLRVVIDAENYREKRERTLEQLANRLAEKVVKTGKNVRLEPMNPYERKVIHATLQSDSRVRTRSEGEEPYRRVIIELK
ncbi:MAG: RNA-binding cell elongation regulator Jag/EloR [Anaerovoracaceae bacterium]